MPVLLKRQKKTKQETQFDPNPWCIIKKNGSMITARRGSKEITRNSSFFKESWQRGDRGENCNAEYEIESDDDEPRVEEQGARREVVNRERAVRIRRPVRRLIEEI